MITPTNAIHFLSAQPWVERLGWTLFHFLWQGALIAAMYAAAQSSRSAQVRYILACAALAAMTVAPIVTFGLMASPQSAPNNPVAGTIPVSPTGAAVLHPSPASLSVVASNSWHSHVMPWLVFAWFAGASVFWIRLTGGWIVAARVRSKLTRPAPAQWQQTLDHLKTRIQISRPVCLLVSAMVQVPTVVGWLRPIVLVPIGALTGLAPDHVEALLAHELAHIRRHDYLVNILQSVAEALLFYHPAVWWISNQIRHERELCCDDIAVAIGGDALNYARALTDLESHRPAHFNPALAANGGSLRDRIARLLGQSSPSPHALPGAGSIAAAVLVVAAAWSLHGQPAHARPAFEVASVKLNQETAGRVYIVPQRSGNRITWPNVTLSSLAYYAYHIAGPYQVTGNLQLAAGHNWYDIEAVAAAPPSDEDLRLMFQTLLEDRFKLRFHRETKELAGFDLVAAKNGPRLKTSTPDSSVDVGGAPLGAGHCVIMINTDGHHLVGQAASIEQMAGSIGRRLDAPVRDRTGLSGWFDFNVLFSPDDNPPDASTAPDLRTALQEKLGLKLEASKVPVEIVVIEHIENPTVN